MAKTYSGTLGLGMSGFGKSYFAGGLAEASNKQRIILDPKNEHRDLAEFLLVIDPAVAARADKMGGWYEFFKQVIATGKSIRIQVKGFTPQQYLDMMDGLAHAMHERGNLFFMADEYHRAAPNPSAMIGNCPPWVLVLHTDARTCGIDFIVLTQRPALLATTVISQANRKFCFRLEYDVDVKKAASIFRNPDASKFKNTQEAMKSLPPRTCLYINSDNSEQVVIDTNQMQRKTKHYG